LENFRLAPATLYNIFGAFTIVSEERVPSWSITSLGVKTSDPGLEFTLQSEANEQWLLLVIRKDKPTQRLLKFQFTGPKTIQVPTPDPEDQNIIVVPVNITDKTPQQGAAARLAAYTLSIRTLAQAPLFTPSPSAAPTPTPSPAAPTTTPAASVPAPTPTPQDALPPPSLADGTLIREQGDARVWIVQNGFLRHVRHPAIFGFYRHLRWEDVREVEPGTVARYRQSALVRALGDDKVYEIDAAGAKRWLNMTPEGFAASGRQWEAVYVINAAERDFYPVN